MDNLQEPSGFMSATAARSIATDRQMEELQKFVTIFNENIEQAAREGRTSFTYIAKDVDVPDLAIAALKEQGYKVTLYCNNGMPDAYEISWEERWTQRLTKYLFGFGGRKNGRK